MLLSLKFADRTLIVVFVPLEPLVFLGNNAVKSAYV